MTARPAHNFALGATRARIIQHQVVSIFCGSPGRRQPSPASRRARRAVCTLLLALAAPVLAQAPGSDVPTTAFGFTYRLPPGWKSASPAATLPAARENALQSAKNPSQELGIACAQVVLSAQSEKPASAIVVAALPYACYGQPMSAKDLSGFAAGVSDGLKQNLNISVPVFGSYTLGTHNFWIERAAGVAKNHPQSVYTVEIACSLLKKSAVCWMTLAADAGALRDFENTPVELDGEPPASLVPIDAFVKKTPAASP